MTSEDEIIGVRVSFPDTLQQLELIGLAGGPGWSPRRQRRHPAPQLRRDLLLESVAAHGPAAVGGGAQLADDVRLERDIEQPAIGRLARRRRVPERQIERMRAHEGIGRAAGVRGVARPRIARGAATMRARTGLSSM